MSVEDVPPSLSPEEAERLAAKITPSWEAPPMDDDGSTEAPVVYQTPIVPPMHAETEPKLVAAEIRREAGAKVPIHNSDIPTSPRTPSELATDEAKAKLAAAVAAADAAADADASADATVRMPSITDGLSDADIVAAEPVDIPAPPRAPVAAPVGSPPRKVPAPTGNMIPYVPENDRTVETGRSLKALSEDEIPVSSIGGGSKTKVFAIVGVVALLAFGGVFLALRTSGSEASAEPSASGHTGMVQPASSKADVPAPEALPSATVPTAVASVTAEPKKPVVATATAAAPVAPPPPKPPVVAVAPPPKAGGGSSGSGAAPKPATPPPGKPGGIVRDNPF